MIRCNDATTHTCEIYANITGSIETSGRQQSRLCRVLPHKNNDDEGKRAHLPGKMVVDARFEGSDGDHPSSSVTTNWLRGMRVGWSTLDTSSNLQADSNRTALYSYHLVSQTDILW